MSELTITQIIKIILGIFVVVVVVGGVGYFFKNYFLDFFNNYLPKEAISEFFLGLIK